MKVTMAFNTKSWSNDLNDDWSTVPPWLRKPPNEERKAMETPTFECLTTQGAAYCSRCSSWHIAHGFSSWKEGLSASEGPEWYQYMFLVYKSETSVLNCTAWFCLIHLQVLLGIQNHYLSTFDDQRYSANRQLWGYAARTLAIASDSTVLGQHLLVWQLAWLLHPIVPGSISTEQSASEFTALWNAWSTICETTKRTAAKIHQNTTGTGNQIVHLSSSSI
jgi:hypothetical protein